MTAEEREKYNAHKLEAYYRKKGIDPVLKRRDRMCYKLNNGWKLKCISKVYDNVYEIELVRRIKGIDCNDLGKRLKKQWRLQKDHKFDIVVYEVYGSNIQFEVYLRNPNINKLGDAKEEAIGYSEIIDKWIEDYISSAVSSS